MTDSTNGMTKPSLTRLVRRAGVKSASDLCYNTIRELIIERLVEIIRVVLITNSEHQTRTLMVEDVYKAMQLLGYNIAQSSDLGTTTCVK
jgi:histone H3/H4